MFDKVEVKESMTLDDVSDILTSFGAHAQQINSGEILADTICHHAPGEGSQKLHYYDNTKLFNCYTCCGVFDIFQLIMSFHERQGIDMLLEDAIDYVVDRRGFFQIDGGATSAFEERREARLEYVKPEIPIYDDTFLKRMPNRPYAGWEMEDISRETQLKYEIKKSSINEAIIFPHYDDNGNLVGVRQRNLLPEAIKAYGKYRPATLAGIMYTSPLSFYLFGLDKNKEAIKRSKKVVVFESEKSVMKLDSLIDSKYNNSVASFGMNFSYYQFKLLEELGVEEIIIAFDRQFQSPGKKDPEYVRYAKKLTSFVERYQSDTVEFSFVVDNEGLLGYKDSPIDRGVRVFNQLLSERFTLRKEEAHEI